MINIVKAWVAATLAFFVFTFVLSKVLSSRYSSGGEYSGALPLFLGVALWCIVFGVVYNRLKKTTATK